MGSYGVFRLQAVDGVRQLISTLRLLHIFIYLSRIVRRRSGKGIGPTDVTVNLVKVFGGWWEVVQRFGRKFVKRSK